jgi:hypothetical protein
VSSTPPALRWPGWLACVRATLLTVVIALCVLKALPSKPYMHTHLIKSSYQHVVRDIGIALRAVGIDITDGAVRTLMVDTSRPLVLARNAIVEPLQPAYDFLGRGQAWGLFLQSGRGAHRIQVQGRAHDGEWQMLYRHHQLDQLGLAPWLNFRRLRGIYSPNTKGPRAQYEGFVSWLAQHVCSEHPELVELRVNMMRIELGDRREPNKEVETQFESARPCVARP